MGKTAKKIPWKAGISIVFLLAGLLWTGAGARAAEDVQEETVQKPISKKGIQGLEAANLGASHILFNITMSEIFSVTPMEGWEEIPVGDAVYYWNDTYCQLMAGELKRAREKGAAYLYCVLLSAEMPGLTYTDETSAAAYYAFDTWSASGQEAVATVFSLIGECWGGLVDYWIVGNEVNDPHQYYEMGTDDLDTYTVYLEKALRICYEAMKPYNEDTAVLVSFDHVWNWTEGKRLNARQLLTRLAEITREEGDYSWGVAYHPFPEPMDHAMFWDDEESGAVHDADTKIITMENIEVLTDFMNREEMKFEGKVRPIALTECGFNAYEEGAENGGLQAAAFT